MASISNIHTLSALLESTAIALLLSDSRGRIVYVNRETERLFGFSRDELVGQPTEHLVPVELRQRHRTLHAAFAAEKRNRDIGHGGNLFGLHKDGTRIPLEIGLTPIDTPDGSFVLASIIDVRRIRDAEEALRRSNADLTRSEARYRGLVEHSIQGILIHVEEVVRLANPALADLLGYSTPEELIGESIWRFVAPEDRDLVTDNIRARMRGERAPNRYAFRVVKRDGSTLWIECTVTLIEWEEKRASLATIFDISEQKRAEEALRGSEERFRQLAGHVKEAFVIVDLPDEQVAYVSPAFEDIWGRKVEEVYRHPELWFDAVHPEDQPRVLADRRAHLHGRATTGIFRVRRPDGSVRWTRYRMFPILDADGRPYRLVGLVEDITEQRIQDEQFRQAQKMEAIGQLAGGIAHDFNNMLTAILGYADLIADELGPSHPCSEDLKEILNAGQSAATLTARILAFSRRQILQPRVLDLNEVLQRTLLLLQRLIGEDIALAIKPATRLMRTLADPGQIEQILINLAINARDAMPHGGDLTIETDNVMLDDEFVRRHRGAAVGPHVMLAVSDSGEGMNANTLQHLFEPFFTTKAPGKGTGLGLATVYGIVKQSGGSIWAYSEPGRGSTFKIFLPAATAHASIGDQQDTTMPANGTETILVVEDQAEVRAVISATLRRHGYTVLDAGIGADAIAVASEHQGPIQLLITDVVLPEMDGRQLARALHAAGRLARTLYTSGYTDEVIVRRGILEAGLAFLQKPFTSDRLLRKVREVLDAPEPPGV